MSSTHDVIIGTVGGVLVMVFFRFLIGVDDGDEFFEFFALWYFGGGYLLFADVE